MLSADSPLTTPPCDCARMSRRVRLLAAGDPQPPNESFALHGKRPLIEIGINEADVGEALAEGSEEAVWQCVGQEVAAEDRDDSDQET